MIDGGKAIKCRGKKRNFRRVYKFSSYEKKVASIVKQILKRVPVFLYRGKQCGVHGSSGKISLQWYSSRMQVIL